MYLYGHVKNRSLEEFKLQAALQGVDLDKPVKGGKAVTQKPTNQSLPMFEDPSAYEKLTPEQREQKTQEMMGAMKRFAADPVKYTSKHG